MFQKNLNWALFVGGYFVSSMIGAVAYMLITCLFASPNLYQRNMLLAVPCVALMLACCALISVWYLKSKNRSYWYLAFLLLPAALIVMLFIPGGLSTSLASLVSIYGMDIKDIRLIVDAFLISGFLLLLGLVPLLLLNKLDRTETVPSLYFSSDSGNSWRVETFVKLNWFARHLNWTMVIVLGVFEMTLFMPWVIHNHLFADIAFAGTIIAPVIIILAGIWVLSMKGLKLWPSTIITTLPLIVALIILLWEWAKGPGMFGYNMLWVVVIMFGQIIFACGVLLSTAAIMLIRNKRYVCRTTIELGKPVRKWYRVKYQFEPVIGENDG